MYKRQFIAKQKLFHQKLSNPYMKSRFLLMLAFVVSLSNLVSAQPLPICAVPQQIAAASSEDGKSAKVRFSNTNAPNYMLQYRLVTDRDTAWTTLSNIVRADSNAVVLKDLKPCALYVMRARAICLPDVLSEWSKVFEFKTLGCTPPICPAPSGLTATVRDTVGLFWKVAQAGAGFTVEYRARLDTVWKTTTVSTNSLVLRGLKPCTDYVFRVKAICGIVGSSPYSEIVAFKTLGCTEPEPCSNPQNLKIFTEDTVAVAYWKGEREKNYILQFKSADSEAWRTITVRGTVYVLTGLKLCANYQVRIIGICSAGTKPAFSEIVKFTTGNCPQPTCAAPKELAGSADANSAKLRWSNTGARAYIVEYNVITSSSLWKTDTVKENAHAIFNLSPCTKYVVRVRSLCALGVSAPSEIFTFATTCANDTCVRPFNLIGSADQTAAKFTWFNANARAYLFEYKFANDTTKFWKTDTVKQNVHAIFNLSPCSRYIARVRSLCANGVSAPSETFTFATTCTNDTCSAPRRTASQLTNETTVLLEWEKTGRSFEVQYRLTTTQDEWRSIKTDTPKLLLSLRPCQIYEWRVRAICGGVVSAWSESKKFETKCPEQPCAPLPMPRITTTRDGIVIFTWDVPLRDTFLVQYRSSSDSVWREIKTTIAQTGLILRGLQPCKEYKMRIARICSNGVIKWLELGFKTPCTAIQNSGNGVDVTKFKNINISPNPGKDVLRIRYDLLKRATIIIRLMNMQGQIVSNINIGQQEEGNYEQTLESLSNLSKGLYMVTILADGQLDSTQKWLKE